ncbi:hypothetical protein [Pseudoalteromonas phage PH357]|nr:hypothetical protein [Pseudoalteromonas phage PH357]
MCMCKACGIRPVARGRKQIKVPHPSGKKGHYEIKHEDEDMCSVCIGYSENSFLDDEDLDFSSLGIDIPQNYKHYEEL